MNDVPIDAVAETAIRLEGVVKEHRDGLRVVRAVDSLDLAVMPGDMVAVTGKSGSGKSTLLNLIGGLEPVTAGLVTIAGQSLVGMDRSGLAGLRRRHIGFIFQNLNLVPSLTAVENIALPLEFDGKSPRSAARVARRSLERIGIEDLADRFPSELSGGERQRVAIARAIVGPRSIVLADEPTAALDDVTSRVVMDLLASLTNDGVAVLVATHDAEFAAYADRVVRLKDGQIEHVSHRPAAPSSPADLLL